MPALRHGSRCAHHLVVDLVKVDLAHFVDDVFVVERHEREPCNKTRRVTSAGAVVTWTGNEAMAGRADALMREEDERMKG